MVSVGFYSSVPGCLSFWVLSAIDAQCLDPLAHKTLQNGIYSSSIISFSCISWNTFIKLWFSSHTICSLSGIVYTNGIASLLCTSFPDNKLQV